MSPDIAGVTFLAFGNGAPDVFSSLVALSSASADRQGALLVGVASLLGAGTVDPESTQKARKERCERYRYP